MAPSANSTFAITAAIFLRVISYCITRSEVLKKKSLQVKYVRFSINCISNKLKIKQIEKQDQNITQKSADIDVTPPTL